MSKFNFDDYKGKYVMHCKTEEEAIDFCNVMDKSGKTWYNGASYAKCTCYYANKFGICYDFNSGLYCYIGFYKSRGYIILEWSDFMEANKIFTLDDLKTGDFIVLEDGSVEMVVKEFNSTITKDGGWSYLSYTEDLKSLDSSPRYGNIMKVYRPNGKGHCSFKTYMLSPVVYDRKNEEIVDMTMEEVCKALGKNVHIVK